MVPTRPSPQLHWLDPPGLICTLGDRGSALSESYGVLNPPSMPLVEDASSCSTFHTAAWVSTADCVACWGHEDPASVLLRAAGRAECPFDRLDPRTGHVEDRDVLSLL